MAKWVHADVLDNGPAYIIANATKMLLIEAYTFGDNYATVTGNIVASADITGVNFTLGTSVNDRLLTVIAEVEATALVTSSVTPNLHIAFTNGVDKVLWVTDEPSDQPITAGNLLLFPEVTYKAKQPV